MTVFTVMLSLEAHSHAQKYSKQHQRSEKAKQVYLNTLAVYAVDFYFQIIGVEIDYDKSDSRQPINQKFIDVADLYVKNVGKFECRPVLPNDRLLEVPPEGWHDRIGYIAVQLDRSLREAKLIGFTPTVADKQGIIPLNELRSIEEFPEYLSQKRQPLSFEDLEIWLQKSTILNPTPKDWQRRIGKFSNPIKSVANAVRTRQSGMVDVNDPESVKRWIKQAYASQPNPDQSQAISLENLDVISALMQLIQSVQNAEIRWQAADYLWQINPDYPGAGEKRFKDLGMQVGDYRVTLIVAILPIPNDKRAIRLQVLMSEQSYLPFGLKLIVLDETGKLIEEVSARSKDDYIQFKFTADPGDRFSVKVALAEDSITEFFAA